MNPADFAPVGPSSWLYKDGTLFIGREGQSLESVIAEHLEAIENAPEQPEPPFPPLNPRQIRLGLLAAGITEEMIDAALAGNATGMIEWKYAPSYLRDHHLIEALAGSFGLTSEQVDLLWTQAAQL